MKICKVYLNSGTERYERKGFFVLGEIISESYKLNKKWKKDKQNTSTDVEYKQALIKQPTYVVKPIAFDPLIKIKKYIERRNVEFTDPINADFIKERNYPKNLDRVM